MKLEPQNAALPAARGTGLPTLTPAVTRATPAVTAGTLTGTLMLAAACWIIAVWQMHGMDMGTATQLGSFEAFIAVWAAMMAAMMLPGAAPALLRRAHAGGVRAVPPFAASYLAVWALAGVAVYVVDRPHGTLVAGAVTVAAGVYEFTPVKKYFRQRSRASTRSGLGFGLCCAGSTIGLMAMLAALGAMSITWMAVLTVLACAQKLLPPKAAIDVPLALAIIGFGAWILIAPAAVPGLVPSM
jgi:predicted metal-binding membrane protein